MTKIKWNVQACLLGLLMAFVGVSFLACSDDDDENNGGGGNVNVTASQLYGTWLWVSDRGWDQEPGQPKDEWVNLYADTGLSLTFYSNGDMYELWDKTGYSRTMSWSLRNGNIISWDGDDYVIIRFTGTELVIEYTEENGWGQVVFRKSDVMLDIDDSDNDDGNDEGEVVNIKPYQIYGTWAWVSDNGWMIEPGKAKETWTNEYEGEGLRMTLNADGTMQQWMNGMVDNLSWTLEDGNKLIMDGLPYIIKSFKGNEATVEFYEKDGGVEFYEQIVYRKVD